MIIFLGVKGNKKERGVAVLPLTLIAILIIMTLGIAVAFVAFVDNMNALSQRKTSEAQIAAQSGANDALERILHNRSFFSAGYNLTINNATATVTVTQNNNCSGSLSGYVCIDSLGQSQKSQSKVRTVASIDPNTGSVTVVSRQTIAI